MNDAYVLLITSNSMAPSHPFQADAMKVRKQCSRLVRPCNKATLSSTRFIRLSVFDAVTYDTHMAVMYIFKPPTPLNATIEQGLQMVLAEYREWAGRLGRDDEGYRAILLNDQGVRFVEAIVDGSLEAAMLLKPSPALLSLHPSLKGVEELLQVQLTRFACGSLVLGFTAHHLVADGLSTSNFLTAWGQATRGLHIDPLPFHDRAIFTPRNPPSFEFEHRGVEIMSKRPLVKPLYTVEKKDDSEIVVYKAHFTLEFLSNLKAKASTAPGIDRPYSTFESLVAHLWRTITKARGLNGHETTRVRISVNGRSRLIPRVPNDYFGNLVLWAFPETTVKELLKEPLHFAAKLIRDSIARVNNNYFKSFIDFMCLKEDMKDVVPTASMSKSALCPNLEVDSWLRFPFYDLDFGGGNLHNFMPSYFPVEGMLFVLPSFLGDGSVDAIVPLFQRDLSSFKKVCYYLD